MICHKDFIKDDTGPIYVFVSGFRELTKEEMRYEWATFTESMDISVIYVADTKGTWYHREIGEMREFLLRRMGDRPAVFVGQSMGGYGALLFAHLTERDSIAFVPQTLLTAHPLSKGIQPWKEKMHKIQQWTDYPQFLDLAFMRGLNHHIYYGVDHPEDRFYAERMGGVCLHPVKWDTHNVAKCLRERGIMKDILERKCISCQ